MSDQLKLEDRGVITFKGRKLFRVTQRPKAKVVVHWSRFEGEARWCSDAYFLDGFPMWVHGDGSRCCIKQSPKEEEAAEFDKISSYTGA